MLPANATHQIALMGALGSAPVSLDALAQRLPMNRAAIIAAAGRLVARGLVNRDEWGVYALSDEGLTALRDGLKIGGDPARRRKEPVYSDSLRQRAWKAMRLTKRFTAGEVASLARQDERDAEDSIRRFCSALCRAGYLVELPARTSPDRPGSNGRKVWRLVRDTGDLAPRYMAATRSFADRNTREVFPCA